MAGRLGILLWQVDWVYFGDGHLEAGVYIYGHAVVILPSQSH